MLKKFCSFVLLISLILLLVGCNRTELSFHDKNHHADTMLFFNTRGDFTLAMSYFMNTSRGENFPHLAFASSHEEAEILYEYLSSTQLYEYGVIVAWPSPATQLMLDLINQELSDRDIDVDTLPLSYPLVLENVVDDWELVYYILQNFTNTNHVLFMRQHKYAFNPQYREKQEYLFERWLMDSNRSNDG